MYCGPSTSKWSHLHLIHLGRFLSTVHDQIKSILRLGWHLSLCVYLCFGTSEHLRPSMALNVQETYHSWQKNGLWTLLDHCRQMNSFAQDGQSRVWRRCFGAKKKDFYFEMVEGSRWTKRVNIKVQYFGPF